MGTTQKALTFATQRQAATVRIKRNQQFSQWISQSALAEERKAGSTPVKCAVMLDSEDNVVGTYNLVPEPIEDVRKALSEIMEYVNNMHCAFLGELTKWS
ncbi:hypothetical protein [Methylotuvimicrobium sp. KM2]|uniref:hypothetical protein n=1 Tax=Methylotuvimicrobium sp. KM2 TaxID=3133976 RepID=UPI003100F7FE